MHYKRKQLSVYNCTSDENNNLNSESMKKCFYLNSKSML